VSTVADYADRRADLLAFRPLSGKILNRRDQLMVPEFVRPGDGGALTAGVQKLAQKILLVLLTRRGSRTYAPDEGTDFMTEAALGFWRTVADVEQAFYSARLDVSRQCRASESDADPEDERWGSLDLDGVTLAGDRVTLRMTAVPLSGAAYTFLTPITVPLR